MVKSLKAPNAILEPRGSVRLDDYVVDLAWSPDSRQMAVAGGEGRIFLLETTSLRAKQVGDHGLGALAVTWQPGGDRFASSGQDSRIAMHAADDGRVLVEKRPAMAWSTALAFSPDGTRLASAAGKQVFLWDTELELQLKPAPLEAGVAALAFDRSGRDLGVAVHGGLIVYRLGDKPLDEKAQLRRYPWSAACLTVAFSPNGKHLATGTQDGSVHFWYLANGKDSQMRGYPTKVDCMGWSGDSRYLATAAHDMVVVWDFSGKGPEGSRPVQLSGHTDRIECLAFQPNGNYLLTGGRDWRISLWQPGKYPAALDAHLTDSEPSSVRWSPDGKLVAVGERNGTLSIYELFKIS